VRRALPLLLLLSTVAFAAPPDKGPSQRELAGLRKVAKAWVKVGRWCLKKDLGDEARESFGFALEALPKDAALSAFKAKADASQADASDLARGQWAKKSAAVRRKVSKLYDGLAKAAGSAERGDDYLLRALQAEPTKTRWSRVLRRLSEAESKRAADLAGRALALDPPETLRAKLERLGDLAAVDALVLRTAKEHPIKYFFSLPKGYRFDADRTWPVLVCVEGAGSNFQGIARGYVKRRGELPFIVVSPCTFANTNAIQGKMLERYKGWYSEDVIAEAGRDRFGWDEAGLLAILAEIQERFGAAPQVCITGFSGGGNLTYLMVFRHPDRVLAAVPACANFSRPGYRSLKGKFSAEDLNFPVHILTGAEDPHRKWTHGKEGMPGIEPQTDAVERLLGDLGYPNVTRTLVPKMKHSAAHDRVLEVLKPYIEGKSRA
jgi:hypothetical protein